MTHLSRSAFADGMKKLSLRFKLPSRDTLEAYYGYLTRRFSDEQFVETCGILFAKSRRFPIPHDFIENAPPRDVPMRLDDERKSPNPYEPVIIRVKKGTQAHRRWENTFEERARLGVTDPRPQRWIDEGYPSPEVVFVD
jgi:hypothetical protein